MFIKNKSARLVTFTWKGEKFPLMPAGKAVEVPDEAKDSVFLNALIDSGDLAKTSKTKAPVLSDEEKAQKKEDAEKAKEAEKEAKKLAAAEVLKALQDKATELKIEFDDTWTAKKLTAAIEKAS